LPPSFTYELQAREKGMRCIAGVDEAGRGPLAGPVVAAAVVLDPGRLLGLERLDDSKKLSPKTRESLYTAIVGQAASWSVAEVSEIEVDRVNILQATFLAMRQAIAGLSLKPDWVLVDGPLAPFSQPPCQTLVGGDALSMSIAAASIIAKVHRDRLMDVLAQRWSGYGFERNKGYGTPQHFSALKRLGPCPAHRKSFITQHLTRLPGLE
jgi:ribonuclease HII